MIGVKTNTVIENKDTFSDNISEFMLKWIG